MPRRDASLIAFALDYWSDYRQTRQHVVGTLAARGWPVTYTTGPHFVWHLRGPRWRDACWRTGAGVSEGVTLNLPGRLQLRWPRLAAWDARVQRLYAAALMRQAGWHSAEHRIALVFHPSFMPYLQSLGDCRVVYYADDSFSKMPGWSAAIEACEAALVARADLIVATSSGVARNLPARGRDKARILPNGVDAELFIRGASDACPPDLAPIPRPRIGYVGTINPKVDIRLIGTIAARRPDWHFVLIGHLIESSLLADPLCRDAWQALRRMPNVHVFGTRPYRALPAYQAHMDVNALLYRTDPGGWWEDVSPLKLYEHLAVGRPVVAADIAALAPVHDLIAIARTPDEWLAAIGQALAGRAAGSVEQGRAAARANAWEVVVARLEVWIEPLLV